MQNLGGNLTVAEARINRYLQEITSLHTNCDNEKKEKELVQEELKGLKAENQDLKAQLDDINTNFVKFRKPLAHREGACQTVSDHDTEEVEDSDLDDYEELTEAGGQGHETGGEGHENKFGEEELQVIDVEERDMPPKKEQCSQKPKM